MIVAKRTGIRWRLRVLMADRKMSATQLGQLMGINRVTVSEWARSDEVPNLRNAQETLTQLCEYLECSVHDLIQDDFYSSLP